ncbi:MAG: head-tail adaptor protein [Cetobacterium sp.]
MSKRGCCGAPVFNKWVQLQAPAGARDAVGERTTVWATQFDDWAAIAPLRVGEILAGGELHGQATHRVQMRWRAAHTAIESTWRVMYGTRVLVLIGPARNLEEGNRITELLCLEGPRKE